MSVTDFVRKQARTARQDGIGTVVRSSAREATLKAMGVAADTVATPIWEGDWDVCLVLDACRVDAMQAVVSDYDYLPDWVERKWSVGSCSPEWMSKTFDRRWHDKMRQTAYVTANPFASKEPAPTANRSRAVFPMRETPIAYLDEVYIDEWNTGSQETVSPGLLTDRARWAWDRRERFDFEQMIVHYMQPHMPFRSRPEWFNGWGGTEKFGETSDQNDRDIWLKLRDGAMRKDEFWAAYLDNLHWVLEHVTRWAETTEARVLVTSDHGNGMGEWGVWSHPPGTAAPAVRRVPWLYFEGDEVVPYGGDFDGVPVDSSDDPALEKKLTALGYR